jgi:pectinesterase
MKKSVLFALLLVAGALSAGAQEPTSTEPKYDIVVDRNGRGNFRNIADAIESIRAFDTKGVITMFVRDGVYKEKLVLPTYVCNLHIIGESREKTIITYDDHANIDKMGTFRTYTFLIRGNDITVENLTIENTALQLGQAVALHLEGDRIIVRNCNILGNQDTIYAGRENCRQYFEDCYIEGTTDYIFGPSTCWFEHCRLLCKRQSYITAASTPENIAYGYIFNHCTVSIAANVPSVALGRPWRPYAMTLFMNCQLPEGISPAGWNNWGKPENEQTARYMEYNNSGPGAAVDRRVAWAKQLTAQEAAVYTLENVMKGSDGWMPCCTVIEAVLH